MLIVHLKSGKSLHIKGDKIISRDGLISFGKTVGLQAAWGCAYTPTDDPTIPLTSIDYIENGGADEVR